MKNIIDDLKEALPPVVYRNHPRFKELTGITPRTMANLDSLGRGPKMKLSQGRMVGYPRDALLEWLASRLKVIPAREHGGHAGQAGLGQAQKAPFLNRPQGRDAQ